MNTNATHYKNGQIISVVENGIMTYFFKDGTIKARGPYDDQDMDGEWTFYRENGQLWQIGHFKNGLKHGSWIRYDKAMDLEYDEVFYEGKIMKKKE